MNSDARSSASHPSEPQPNADVVPSTSTPTNEPALDRRRFLTIAGASGLALPALAGLAEAQPVMPSTAQERASASARIRSNAAKANFQAGFVSHPKNGDEQLYPDFIGNFSKGLPHNAYGEVVPSAYVAMTDALSRGSYLDLEFVPPGEANSQRRIKLVNPLAGLAYDLQGCDAQNTTVRAAPALASAENAGEIVENYWMAMLRDVPFAQYDSHPLVAQACADLSALSDFRGPKVAGQVTPQTLFRDPAPGCAVGPYLSQFWFRSIPFGAQYVEPRMRTVQPGVDYGTTPAAWLALQNGTRPLTLPAYDSVLRYMRNGRDLSQWVHIDVLYQAYFQAMLIMKAAPDPADPFTGGGLGIPMNPGNPYLLSLMQDGFTTFGGPHCAALTTEVSTRALKATWFQKWFVHRHLRPEAFAGRVHHKLVNARPYPLHPDVLNSAAVARIQSLHGGNAFLPLAYPEGCPGHPSYTAGHATVAGACVTILKAFFYTDAPWPNPRIPSDDGLTLLPYTGPGAAQMTIGGELNKLAMNVAYGRNIAGVHWRSDGYESLRLGEEVAISVLKDQRETYFEDFQGFTFRKFDGSIVTI